MLPAEAVEQLAAGLATLDLKEIGRNSSPDVGTYTFAWHKNASVGKPV